MALQGAQHSAEKSELGSDCQHKKTQSRSWTGEAERDKQFVLLPMLRGGGAEGIINSLHTTVQGSAGTTWPGSRIASHLHQHPPGMWSAQMLWSAGLKERILSCPCRGVGLR